MKKFSDIFFNLSAILERDDGRVNFGDLTEELQNSNPALLSMLKEMLQTEASQRKSAEELLTHVFILDGEKSVRGKRQDRQIERMKKQIEEMARENHQLREVVDGYEREKEDMRNEIIQMKETMTQFKKHFENDFRGVFAYHLEKGNKIFSLLKRKFFLKKYYFFQLMLHTRRLLDIQSLNYIS